MVRDGVSAVLDPDTRLVTVTGLDDGQSAVLTMTVTRTGYDTDDATVSGAALDAARTVAFDASTATETGFTAQIQDFDTDYTWTVTATRPDGAQADADQIVTDTGLVTVTGVDPGTAASVTVQAEIPGETLPGTGTGNGTSLNGPARTPVFDDEALVRVEGGSRVRSPL